MLRLEGRHRPILINLQDPELTHLALGTEGHQTADVKVMARRVAQYFSERKGLSGNYEQVLNRLTK